MDLPALVADYAARNADRLASLDSLTAQGEGPLGPDDAVLVPPGEEAPGAIGVLRSTTIAADDPAALWRPLSEHELEILGRGDAKRTAAGAQAVLELLEDELTGRAIAGDEEHTVSIRTLAHDDALLEPLRRHFFAPVAVTALRRVSASERLNASYPIRLPAGVSIEPVAQVDRAALLEAAVRAWTHGPFQMGAYQREASGPAIEETVAGIIDAPSALSAVALREGRIIGVSLVSRAGENDPAYDITPVRPLAVARLLWLDPAERGRGIAHSLVADAHGRMASASLPWSATRYPANRAMNGYFWNREGYRPLAVHWGRTPALDGRVARALAAN